MHTAAMPVLRAIADLPPPPALPFPGNAHQSNPRAIRLAFAEHVHTLLKGDDKRQEDISDARAGVARLARMPAPCRRCLRRRADRRLERGARALQGATDGFIARAARAADPAPRAQPVKLQQAMLLVDGDMARLRPRTGAAPLAIILRQHNKGGSDLAQECI